MKLYCCAETNGDAPIFFVGFTPEQRDKQVVQEFIVKRRDEWVTYMDYEALVALDAFVAAGEWSKALDLWHAHDMTGDYLCWYGETFLPPYEDLT